ncbi:MAG: ADP-forming succinate--CoA ligase subunit beta [Enterobacterales bacterium]
MNLHEYQSKYLLNKYSVPIPKGYICSNIKNIDFILSKFNYPLVVKCQIHSGGRGKSGGIKLIKSKNDVFKYIEYWKLNKLITNQNKPNGQTVKYFLIEESISVNKELYLSIVIDRNNSRIICISSSKGGIHVESLSSDSDKYINIIEIDPLIGAQEYQGRIIAYKLGLYGHQISQFNKIFIGISKLLFDYDLSLIEINPLAITKSMNLICLDAKISVDDNSLFRQPELSKMRDNSQVDNYESYAINYGLNYVSLNGYIGCIVNGAGLAMATMDIIKLYGGEPANFLDIGGNASQNCILKALKIILYDKKVKSILINIFGGIVRCDLMANGIVIAISKLNINIPVIVRLNGNMSDLGNKILSNSKLNIISYSNLTDAVKYTINISKKREN